MGVFSYIKWNFSRVSMHFPTLIMGNAKSTEAKNLLRVQISVIRDNMQTLFAMEDFDILTKKVAKHDECKQNELIPNQLKIDKFHQIDHGFFKHSALLENNSNLIFRNLENIKQ